MGWLMRLFNFLLEEKVAKRTCAKSKRFAGLNQAELNAVSSYELHERRRIFCTYDETGKRSLMFLCWSSRFRAAELAAV